MKSGLICLIFFMVPFLATSQIKINSPYKQKQEKEKEDKTYIPDAGAPDTPSDVVSGDVEQEETAVSKVVTDMFGAMKQGNSNLVKSLFAEQGRLMSTESDGSISVVTVDEFAKSVGQATRGALDERVTSMEIRIDDHLATAWVEYDFFYEGKFNHCGVDAFQLHKSVNGWKIMQISDTKKANCVAGGKENAINSILDQWHAAAGKADVNGYFNSIGADAVYLGTDPGERWDKNAFYQFSKPFFDKGNAWDFKPKERNVSFSDDGKVAWFDELLDTWMGICRGSGVLEKQVDGTWKIAQYNVAILVPNDLVQDYMKLVDSKK